MLAHYRRLFTDPQCAKLTIGGFVMRLPNSMIALSLVMIVSDRTGSYKLAGSVAASYSLSAVATNPFLGRFMDRYGQARIAGPATALLGVGLIGLIITAHAHYPQWTFYFWAIVISAGLVPVGPMVRARWANLLNDRNLLVTAYSWEQVMTELGFILGPVIVTVLAASIDASAGLTACLIFAVAGATVLLPQNNTAPPARKTASQSGSSAFKTPGIVFLFGISLGFGGLLQSLPVAAVAFAEEYHSRSSAGWLLAIMASSSLISAVAHGLRRWRIQLFWQLMMTTAILTVGIACASLSTNIVLVAASILLAGTAVGPSGITINVLAQRLAPVGALTETLAFTGAGNPLGGAIGASMTGWWIDTYGPRFAFVVAALCGATAVAIMTIGARWLMVRSEGHIPEIGSAETRAVVGNGALVTETDEVSR